MGVNATHCVWGTRKREKEREGEVRGDREGGEGERESEKMMETVYLLEWDGLLVNSWPTGIKQSDFSGLQVLSFIWTQLYWLRHSCF